ncbi:MAG TPA: hypothetical protein VJ820_18930 [Propionibacteriaceae bacterium]|nr:hypothetical protein [Propionibacteriaceae bacterium]
MSVPSRFLHPWQRHMGFPLLDELGVRPEDLLDVWRDFSGPCGTKLEPLSIMINF